MSTAAVVHQPEGQGRALTFDSPKAAHKSLLRLGSVLAPLLPKGVELNTFASSVYFWMQKTPDLANCTTPSLLEAFTKAARSGLQLGVTCYILPFRNNRTGTTDATFIPDYKGVAQKMIASGKVRAVDARVVRQGDHFEYEQGLDERLEHVVVGGSTRPITHAYVILKLPRGERSFLVMDVEEIDGIRTRYSKQWKNGQCPAWYAKKTVILQIAKTIPDPTLLHHLQMIDDAEGPTVLDADQPVLTMGADEPDDTPVLLPSGEPETARPVPPRTVVTQRDGEFYEAGEDGQERHVGGVGAARRRAVQDGEDDQ